jgi:seryl-tRNA synthetase
MLNKQAIRNDPAWFKEKLAQRGDGYGVLVDRLLSVDEERRAAQSHLDDKRQTSNQASKEVGALFKAGEQEQANELKARLQELKAEIKGLEQRFNIFNEQEHELLLALPNITLDDVPVGDEDNARTISEPGTLPTFDFSPRDHVELCEINQLVNFEAGSRIAGSGFPVMSGNGALLQRALISFMLDTHLAHGYTELRPPFIVSPHCAEGTGQLPKFGDEMYHVSIARDGGYPEQPDYYLIPTAEVPLVNYYRGQILETPKLPLKYCAYSPCWRVEAGSYGKEARGLTRLHQFEKVELVVMSARDSSAAAHDMITQDSERILELLGLTYRRILLPSGDMAFGSAKTYDLEVYCPGEGAWREVSSASNTTDYQSRRANIRYRDDAGGKPEYPHMLNSSGVALPRLVIALLETYQREDGSIRLPDVLVPYFNGRSEITGDSSIPFR